jgi:hypothetical protein
MLLRKYQTAISDRNQQSEAHRGFTASLPKELVAEWRVMLKDWENATYPKYKNAKTNPYEIKANRKFCSLNIKITANSGRRLK